MKKLVRLLAVGVLACSVLVNAQSWNASPVIVPIDNDPNVGTSQYTLAKLTASGQAVTIGTSDTTGIIGVVSQNGGKTGRVGLAVLGHQACQFDGATVANDYVIASPTMAGACHDAGNVLPTGVSVVGRTLSSNPGAGVYDMWLEIRAVSYPVNVATLLTRSNNLSDVSNAATALANLGGVNATQAAAAGAAAAPVQRVGGVNPVAGNVALASSNLTDGSSIVKTVNGVAATNNALTLPLFNQQFSVAGANVTQRPKLNVAAGAGISLTPTDNGSDTSTLTIAATNLGVVTNVGIGTFPSWLTGSVTNPTSNATINISLANGQTSHQVLGTCGTATSISPCNLTVGDLPTGYLYSALTGTPVLYNQVIQSGGAAVTQRPKLNIAAGSNVTITPTDNGSDTTTLTVAVPTLGITGFSVTSVPSWLTASVATSTTTPALTLLPAAAQASHQVIGTCGTATTFGPCGLTVGDLPTGYLYSNLSGSPTIYNQTLQASGTAVTQRAKFNLAAGAGIILTPADNGLDTTTFTIAASVPSVFNQTIQVAGTPVTQRNKLNFVAGSNLSVTPSDNGSDTTTLTINTTGGGTVTNFPTPTVPSWITASVTNPTTTPTLTLSPAAGQLQHKVLGTCGSATTFGPCSLTVADLPASVVGQPAFSQAFTAQTSVLLVHNFNTPNVITQCYDATNTMIVPGSVVVTDANDVTVTFAGSQTGRCVVSGQTGPTGGSATAWNTVTAGTNTSGPMVIGSGASLSASGTGTITANGYSGTLPAAALPTPTSTTLGGVKSVTCGAGIGSVNTDGSVSCLSGSSNVTSVALNGGTAQTGAVNLSAVTQIAVNGGAPQTGPVSITVSSPDSYTVGNTGITVGHIVASDSTPNEVIRYPWPSSACNAFGVAQSSVSIGGTVVVKTSGLQSVVADAAIPVGNFVTCSKTTSGYVGDTGQSLLSKIPAGTRALGQVETASTGAGTTAVVRWMPEGTYGVATTHSFGASFTNGGSPLSGGALSYVTVPFACVINGWNITADAGSVSFDVWRSHAGTAIPGSSSSIVSSNYPALSTGTAIQSTSVTGWSVGVTANDIFAIQLRGSSGSPTQANLQVTCQ